MTLKGPLWADSRMAAFEQKLSKAPCASLAAVFDPCYLRRAFADFSPISDAVMVHALESYQTLAHCPVRYPPPRTSFLISSGEGNFVSSIGELGKQAPNLFATKRT